MDRRDNIILKAKRRRLLASVIPKDVEAPSSSNAGTSYTENEHQSNLNQIEQNINDRKDENRMKTTLESKDGCPGEFFECNLYILNILTPLLKKSDRFRSYR